MSRACFGQLAKGRGRAGDDGAGAEATEDGVHDQARVGGCGGRAEDDDSGGDTADCQRVQPAVLVRGDAWNDQADGEGCVDNCKEVAGQRGAHVSCGGVCRQIEKGREHADEHEEQGDEEHDEARLFVGRQEE